MQTKIIDGKIMRNRILEKVREGISLLPFRPAFCDVLVGNDPASRQYVEMKAKTAEKAGIRFHRLEFGEADSAEKMIREIKGLEKIPGMCGVIVQLPLPEIFAGRKREILDSVPEKLDVDCLGTSSSAKFYEGRNEIGFPTALACMEMLYSVPGGRVPGEWLKGKKIAVLGQGELVGKPVATLLRFRGLEPDTVRSKTENRQKIIKEADVIISGIGKGRFITGEMIKEGAVLIDAGTSESDGGIAGDIDRESVEGVAGFLSPVPGGVGPVTVAMLLSNVLKVAQLRAKNHDYQ
jgi:methylenetetrahydrofolate dehydrogenase (NADP+) / methenyltetrahydrofolate cyclohydrolase